MSRELLTKAGVLGLNKRNRDFILKYNNRKLYPLVDDKLETKRLALKAGVAVPQLRAVINIQRQIRDLDKTLSGLNDFALKPAGGSGGDGIIVFSGRSRGLYRKVSGLLMTKEEIEDHISNILNGVFSLGGQPDKVIIEDRVEFDPLFEPVTYQGVPDIRIIVFLGVPVMAMVRLPTRSSEGKANLHKGAVGAGLSIATGITTTGVIGNSPTDLHPDTGESIVGIEVPGWSTLLEIASRCYEMTGLGYQGVDLVLDKVRGPLLLELNARPGLNIQIANRVGLRPRLELLEKNSGLASQPVAERIAFAQNHFL
jgi:alpha-L-glutamate ligase-like protein